MVCYRTYSTDHCSGFKLTSKFREKFCLFPRIFGRSFSLTFRFAYIFYTFSLLPQLKIGRSLFFWGDCPVGYSLLLDPKWSIFAIFKHESTSKGLCGCASCKALSSGREYPVNVFDFEIDRNRHTLLYHTNSKKHLLNNFKGISNSQGLKFLC